MFISTAKASTSGPRPCSHKLSSLNIWGMSVSSTLGQRKIQRKFPNSLFIRFEIFLRKSSLHHWPFWFVKFWNKQRCWNTEIKTVVQTLSINPDLKNRLLNLTLKVTRSMFHHGRWPFGTGIIQLSTLPKGPTSQNRPLRALNSRGFPTRKLCAL